MLYGYQLSVHFERGVALVQIMGDSKIVIDWNNGKTTCET
jgi:hypothetical protein